MARLFSRKARRPIVPGRAPRARLRGLESLETRDCPAAPALTMFAHSAGDGELVIAGRVRDESPSTAVVHLTGAVSADVTPDAAGYYRVVLTPTGSGPVQGQAIDGEGLTSAGCTDANFADDPTPPHIINFNIGQRGGHQVVVTGQVWDDENFAGLPVYFSGIVNGSATTNADGMFTAVLTASSLGWACANVENDEGEISDDYWVELGNSKPEVLTFTAYQVTGGDWVITGTVNDEAVRGLMVTLSSDIPVLNGRQVKVASNGTFQTMFSPPAGFQGGTVSASVTDWWGAMSDTVYSSFGSGGSGGSGGILRG